MDTRKSSPESRVFAGGGGEIPALLVAWAPPGAVSADLGVVAPPFTVGRSSDADLTIADDKVSGSHFRISRAAGGFRIADLGSTNGTFVDGAPLTTKKPLGDAAIIRVGRAVLVFHAAAAALLEPPSGETYGLAGRFHTGPLLGGLREAARAADVPTIFQAVLRDGLARHGLDADEVVGMLGGDHFESLCLDGFEADNVRGLVDLSDRLATRLAAGADGPSAVTSIFRERFGDGPVAHRQTGDSEAAGRSSYERNREAILAAFRECDGNLSATERLLRDRGLRTSRRWLAVFLERWGER